MLILERGSRISSLDSSIVTISYGLELYSRLDTLSLNYVASCLVDIKLDIEVVADHACRLMKDKSSQTYTHLLQYCT